MNLPFRQLTTDHTKKHATSTFQWQVTTTPWFESPVTLRCANSLRLSSKRHWLDPGDVRSHGAMASRLGRWRRGRKMPNRSATASVSSYGNPMEIPEPLISWPFRNVWDWILDCEQHKNITPNWIVHSSLWQTCRCLRLPMSASKCHTYTHARTCTHI
jgi:hypothetical protein